MSEKINFDDPYIKRIYENRKDAQPESEKGIHIVSKNDKFKNEEIKEVVNSIPSIDMRIANKADQEWVDEIKNIQSLNKAHLIAQVNNTLEPSEINKHEVKDLENRINISRKKLDDIDARKDLLIENYNKRSKLN